MSLNRGVAALGAVAVVGAATLGITLPIAAHYAPSKPMVAVTAGSNWTQFAPVCWNKGDELTAKQLATCSTDLSKAALPGAKGTPTVSVAANTTFMINTNEDIANKGWSAEVGQTELVARTTNQQVGNIPLASVQQAAQSTSAPIVVIEGDPANKKIYGVWLFQVKQQGSSS